MSLQLNEPTFKEFYGRNIDQMPNLIAEGRTPLSVSGLMERRLETLGASKPVKESWWNNYFDTGDGVFYHPDGRIRVVLDAKPLREINPESKLQNRTLVLPDGLYEQLEGEEFTREQVAKYVDRLLTSKDAKNNPVWMALARDQKLLNDYVDAVFSEATQQFGYKENMGVYVANAQNVPTGRLWTVGGLRDNSNADGRGSLDYGIGRLVGVEAAEPQVAREKSDSVVVPSLEEVLKVTSPFIANVNMEQLREALTPLYK